MNLDEAELAALVGHRFPGGRYRVAHWENWLLTDCTGSEQLPSPLVHPVALFHLSILGSRISIQELFAMLRAASQGGVSLVGYDWELLQPLREDVDYVCEGGITEAQRHTGTEGRASDAITFLIEVFDDDARPVARVTNRWRIYRDAA